MNRPSRASVEEEEAAADPRQPPLKSPPGGEENMDPTPMNVQKHKREQAGCPCPTPLGFLERRKYFKWQIKGFSLLLNSLPNSLFSEAFEAEGFMWKLQLRVDKDRDAAVLLSIYLCISSPLDDIVLLPKYKLRIYNSLHSSRSISLKGKQGVPFCKASKSWGLRIKKSIETFMSPDEGFVTNDTCVIGAKIIIVSVLPLAEGISQCFTMKRFSPDVFQWKVYQQFLAYGEEQEIRSPTNYSAGGFNWYLKLYRKEGDGSEKESENNDCLSVYLYLDVPSSGSLNLPIYVDFSLAMTVHTATEVERKAHHKFSSLAYSWGWPRFRPLVDVEEEFTLELRFINIGVVKIFITE